MFLIITDIISYARTDTNQVLLWKHYFALYSLIKMYIHWKMLATGSFRWSVTVLSAIQSFCLRPTKTIFPCGLLSHQGRFGRGLCPRGLLSRGPMSITRNKESHRFHLYVYIGKTLTTSATCDVSGSEIKDDDFLHFTVHRIGPTRR